MGFGPWAVLLLQSLPSELYTQFGLLFLEHPFQLSLGLSHIPYFFIRSPIPIKAHLISIILSSIWLVEDQLAVSDIIFLYTAFLYNILLHQICTHYFKTSLPISLLWCADLQYQLFSFLFSFPIPCLSLSGIGALIHISHQSTTWHLLPITVTVLIVSSFYLRNLFLQNNQSSLKN